MTAGAQPGSVTPSGGSGAVVGPAPPRRLQGTAWSVRGGEVDLTRPRVMGVLNLTPDSFSDGGRIRDVEHALDEAERLVADGAAVLDVGGESTRPGAEEVPAAEQLRRILPFLERAADRVDVPISVDTRSAEVARRALEAGAAVVNDVSGFAHDPAIGEVAAEAGAGVVLMHMRGTPATMRDHARYADVVDEVVRELSEAIARARAAGVPHECIAVDPGLGFAKTAEHSVRVLGGLASVVALGYPVLVGPGRKSFLGELLDAPVDDRAAGTVSACVVAYLRGARILRVHDVKAVVQALAVAAAVEAVAMGPEEGGR